MENKKQIKNRYQLKAAVAVLFFCAVVGFTQKERLLAAVRQIEDDPQNLEYEYLDPFNLTVTKYTFDIGILSSKDIGVSSFNSGTGAVAAAAFVPLTSGGPAVLGIIPYYRRPPTIWIPYKPEFRSPCTPGW